MRILYSFLKIYYIISFRKNYYLIITITHTYSLELQITIKDISTSTFVNYICLTGSIFSKPNVLLKTICRDFNKYILLKITGNSCGRFSWK